VVYDKLLAAVEEIEEADLAGGAFEDVVLVEANHGEIAHFGMEGVAGMEGFFFFG
jgi:hypothetical protein